jgi:hypothetical protein
MNHSREDGNMSVPMPRYDLEEVAKALHVSLPASLAGLQHAGEDFTERVEPAALLDPGASEIWGGQMLPDSLPLFDNDAGDRILARFAMDGSIREFVEWRHEGSGWWPTDLVPGYESPIASLQREAKEALRSGLRAYCDEHGGAGAFAEDLGVSWAVMSSWLDDDDLIDADARARIRKKTSLDDRALFTQDWALAEHLAQSASRLRADLAWPGAVFGRAADRRREPKLAITGYVASLKGLRTTAAFTEVWDVPGSPYPFAASRLKELTGNSQPKDANILACLTGDLELVRKYWMDTGSAQLKAGQAVAAYESFFRAGWDWYFTNDMEVVLGHLVQAADATGSSALSALSRLHLRSWEAVTSR